jgi:hypothetical protein
MVAQPENVRISLKMTAGLVVEAPFRKSPNMARGATPFRKAIKLFAIPPAHARGTKTEVLFEKQAAPAL